jgi:anti-anti-sigma factor
MDDELLKTNKGAWVITPSPGLDAQTTAELVQAIDELDASEPRIVVLKIGSRFALGPESENQSGLLMRALGRYQTRGGSVRLICNDPQLRKLFEITGFARSFQTYSDEESATEG